MTKEILQLNRVSEEMPTPNSRCLLWSEVNGTLFSPVWAQVARVRDLPRKPLLDFNQPGVIRDLVWLVDEAPTLMTEDDLWSKPVIQIVPKKQIQARTPIAC